MVEWLPLSIAASSDRQLGQASHHGTAKGVQLTAALLQRCRVDIVAKLQGCLQVRGTVCRQ